MIGVDRKIAPLAELAQAPDEFVVREFPEAEVLQKDRERSRPMFDERSLRFRFAAMPVRRANSANSARLPWRPPFVGVLADIPRRRRSAFERASNSLAKRIAPRTSVSANDGESDF